MALCYERIDNENDRIIEIIYSSQTVMFPGVLLPSKFLRVMRRVIKFIIFFLLFYHVVLSCRSYEMCIFDLKVVYIHPFWLRICLPYTFDYAGAFPDSLEAKKRQKWHFSKNVIFWILGPRRARLPITKNISKINKKQQKITKNNKKNKKTTKNNKK